MSDKFETFIRENRQGLDTSQPSGELWQKINARIGKTPVIKSKFSWLKYFAFGASAITVFVCLKMNLKNSAEKLSVNENLSNKNAIIPAALESQTAIAERPDNSIQTQIDNSPLTNISPAFTYEGTAEQTGNNFQPSAAMNLPVNVTNSYPENNIPVFVQTNYSAGSASTKFFAENNDVKADTAFSGIKTLIIKGEFVDLTIKANTTGDQVLLTSDMKTNKHAPDYKISYQRKDSVLNVTIENENKVHFEFGIIEDAILNIDVPDKINLIVDNSSGNVNASGLDGKICDIKTNSGNIHVDNINTDIKLRLSSGDLDATKINGIVNAETSSGNQTYDQVTGNMKLGLTSGDLQITNEKGTIDAETNSGNQTFKEINGDLKTNSTSGDVTVQDMNGNSIITTRQGNIDLDNCKGNLTATSNSGDITGKKIELIDNSELETSSGNITMKLVNPLDDLSFDLHANFGNINIEKDGKKLHADDENNQLVVKQGKIMIKATSTSGDQSFR